MTTESATQEGRNIVCTLTLPVRFWDDHTYRNSGEYPVGTEIKRNSRTVTATFTAEEFDNLWSDADYYADCAACGEWSRSDDPALWAIGQSAVRTVAAIKKQRG